ncbi:MAG: hypothetical protein LC746_08595 [Acidobacteria bacterium]|nr:hypothetical protein [Acidobacteriota bacterium]
MKDVVQWTAPAQMWRDAAGLEQPGARRAALQRPAILRFAKDSFMQDLLTLLENDPARLTDHVAQPETWRDTVPAPAPVEVAPRFALPFQRARQALESRRQARLLAARGLSGEAKTATQNTSAPVSTMTGAPTFAREKATTLKLYQPAHQRFYMIASCLVCGRAGLPDKSLDKGRDETATFVVRRLFPATVVSGSGARVQFVDPHTGAVDQTIPLPAFDETWEEYALVSTTDGETGWQKVVGGKNATADVLVDGEEKLPLFPVNFTDDEGRRRRVLTGLVPVGKRETYAHATSLLQSQLSAAATNAAASSQGSSSSSSDPSKESLDPRMMKLWLDVTEPWKALLQKADAARAVEDPTWLPGHAVATPSGDAPFDLNNATQKGAHDAAVKSARELLQTGSWYVLLDFAKFLEENLPKVWAAVVSPSAVAALAGDAPQLAVYNALKSAKLTGGRATTLFNESKLYQQPGKIKKNLVVALRAVLLEDANPTAQERLEAAAVSYDRDAHAPDNPNAPDPTFPSFLFPLAHTERDGDDALGPLPVVTIKPDAKDSEFDRSKKKIDALADLIKAAFERKPAPVAAQLPLAAQKPMDAREGFYVVRCVYERPLCGPIDPPVVSAPTREFQMAGFFDPDAPARPVRIALPVDTSPAGLRKFDKNTAFMMSDVLCGQIERMKGITLGDLVRTVLPWPLHKDLSVPDGGACADGGLQMGMICSLSIPIITICALILLMIIVSLLDFIFRWLPFFIICFPLPGFAAKKK